MKHCSNNEVDQLIRQLVRQGRSYYHGTRHGRLTHPRGWPTLTVVKSPSDYHSLHNLRRDLRHVIS